MRLMPSWLKAVVWALGLMIVFGLIYSIVYSYRAEQRYEAIQENAKQELLAEAPIGSDFEHVVEVLKKLDYASRWELDDKGELWASKGIVLEEFTWQLGPASWELILICQFQDNKLTDVRVDMRATAL